MNRAWRIIFLFAVLHLLLLKSFLVNSFRESPMIFLKLLIFKFFGILKKFFFIGFSIFLKLFSNSYNFFKVFPIFNKNIIFLS